MSELTLEQALVLLDEAREQHAATLNRLYEIFNIDDSDGEVRAKWALLEAGKVVKERDALAAHVEALRRELQACQNVLHMLAHDGQVTPAYANDAKKVLAATPAQCLAQVRADAVSSLSLDCYDAGYLNDFRGGNVGWWQDYIRSELASAHDFYQSQVQQYADSIRQEK